MFNPRKPVVRVLNKLSEYNGFIIFQLATACLVGLICAFGLPMFLMNWRPERERHANLVLESNTCHGLEGPLLPPIGASPNQRVNASMVLRDHYNKMIEHNGPYQSMYNFSWLSSILDITLKAENLDPDSAKFDFVVYGQSYGLLTHSGNHDLLMLSAPSVTVDDRVPQPAPSCRLQGSSSFACADMAVTVGDQQLSYATADDLGPKSIAVDVSASVGLDNYPFDTYTASGIVKASITMQLSKLYWFTALKSALHFDKTLNDSFREQQDKTLASWMEYYQSPNVLSDMDELTKPVDVRLQFQPSLQGWNIMSVQLETVHQLTTESHWAPKTAPPGSTTTPAESNSTDVRTIAVISYNITYQRSGFIQGFAISILLVMWILSIYLLIIALDHVFLRPRKLEPDTVGYSVGMLFALPALRMLLEAPFGSYIDFLGFGWNMVTVAIAVFILFTGSFIGHHHNSEFLTPYQEPPQHVAIADGHQDKFVQLVHTAVHDYGTSKKGNGGKAIGEDLECSGTGFVHIEVSSLSGGC